MSDPMPPYRAAVTGATHPAERLSALAAVARQIAVLQAPELALLASIAADPLTVSLPGAADRFGGDKDWAVEDVAVALRLSPAAARARLAEAAEAARVPRLLSLLAAGEMSFGHLRAVADVVRRFDGATVSAIEDRVLTGSVPPGQMSLAAWRARVRRAVLIEAAESIEQQRAANVAERRVCVQRAGEGTSTVWALLPDAGAAALMAAVTALAERRDLGDQCPGASASNGHKRDERTADQRRADALVQLGLDALAGRHSAVLPGRSALRPAVQVTVALSTLLHADEQPGELRGIGPIPANLARALAHDPSGTWSRLVTDPVGRLLDYGRSTYRPLAALARYVSARDRTCRFPRCTRSATRSELDHTLPWASGGTTAPDNLTALCPRHHHLRHDTAWEYRRNRQPAASNGPRPPVATTQARQRPILSTPHPCPQAPRHRPLRHRVPRHRLPRHRPPRQSEPAAAIRLRSDRGDPSRGANHPRTASPPAGTAAIDTYGGATTGTAIGNVEG